MSEIYGRLERMDNDLSVLKGKVYSSTMNIITSAEKLQGKCLHPEKNWKEIEQLAIHIKDIAETLKGFSA